MNINTFEEFEQHEIDAIVDFIENMIEAHLTVIEEHDISVELVDDEFALNITGDDGKTIDLGVTTYRCRECNTEIITMPMPVDYDGIEKGELAVLEHVMAHLNLKRRRFMTVYTRCKM